MFKIGFYIPSNPFRITVPYSVSQFTPPFPVVKQFNVTTPNFSQIITNNAPKNIVTPDMYVCREEKLVKLYLSSSSNVNNDHLTLQFRQALRKFKTFSDIELRKSCIIALSQDYKHNEIEDSLFAKSLVFDPKITPNRIKNFWRTSYLTLVPVYEKEFFPFCSKFIQHRLFGKQKPEIPKDLILVADLLYDKRDAELYETENLPRSILGLSQSKFLQFINSNNKNAEISLIPPEVVQSSVLNQIRFVFEAWDILRNNVNFFSVKEWKSSKREYEKKIETLNPEKFSKRFSTFYSKFEGIKEDLILSQQSNSSEYLPSQPQEKKIWPQNELMEDINDFENNYEMFSLKGLGQLSTRTGGSGNPQNRSKDFGSKRKSFIKEFIVDHNIIQTYLMRNIGKGNITQKYYKYITRSDIPWWLCMFCNTPTLSIVLNHNLAATTESTKPKQGFARLFDEYKQYFCPVDSQNNLTSNKISEKRKDYIGCAWKNGMIGCLYCSGVTDLRIPKQGTTTDYFKGTSNFLSPDEMIKCRKNHSNARTLLLKFLRNHPLEYFRTFSVGKLVNLRKISSEDFVFFQNEGTQTPVSTITQETQTPPYEESKEFPMF